MMHGHRWTARDDAIIIEMWLAKATATEIGLRLGVSKNAVIGHKRKLDLPGRPSPIGNAPGALKIDFGLVHKLRTSGMPWEEVGAVVKHPGSPLSKWYYAQCAKRNVVPAQVTQPAKRMTVARRKAPAKQAPIFSDIHKAREAGVIWETLATGARWSRNGIRKWYSTECSQRGIQQASGTVDRVSHITFRKEAPVEATPPPDPISGGVLYESLPRGCCNWPLNDARPWRMCGDPAGRDVYCGEHTIEADQKKQAERRRRLECRGVMIVAMVGEVAA